MSSRALLFFTGIETPWAQFELNFPLQLINPPLGMFGPWAIFCEVQVLNRAGISSGCPQLQRWTTMSWFLVQKGIDSHCICCNAWVYPTFSTHTHNWDLLHRAQGKPVFLFLIEHWQMFKRKLKLFAKQTVCPPAMGLVAKSLSVIEVLFPRFCFGMLFPFLPVFFWILFSLQLRFPGLCRDTHLCGLKLPLNLTFFPPFSTLMFWLECLPCRWQQWAWGEGCQ